MQQDSSTRGPTCFRISPFKWCFREIMSLPLNAAVVICFLLASCQEPIPPRIFRSLRVYTYLKNSSTACGRFCFCELSRCRNPFLCFFSSSQCFCGDAEPDVAEGICNFECGGDDTEICGGFDAISVYTIGDTTVTPPSEDTPAPVVPQTTPAPAVPLPTGPYSFVGCYTDSRTARVLSDIVEDSSTTMTTKVTNKNSRAEMLDPCVVVMLLGKYCNFVELIYRCGINMAFR